MFIEGKTYIVVGLNNLMSTSNQPKGKKAKEYLDTLQRLQAEFENYQKRVSKEQINFMKYAKEELILKLLDVVDNFERANVRDEGVKLIEKQFKNILKQEGVSEVEAKTFDPNFHEAILTEECDKKEGVVLEVLQKGYKLHDKVIRPTKVKVAGGIK